MEEGRGIPGKLPSLFPHALNLPPPPPPTPRLSQECHFKDKRQIGFHRHYQCTHKTTVKQKCEKKWRIEKKILLAKLAENWRYKCFVFVVNAHAQILTSLKKSPTHLAIIRTSIIGIPKLMFPVASIKITVRLIVIRTTPPARRARKEQKTVRQLTTKHASWSVVNRGEAVFRKAQARKVLCMPYGKKKCGTTAAIHYKCIFLHWFGKRFRLATVVTTLWSNTQRGVYS